MMLMMMFTHTPSLNCNGYSLPSSLSLALSLSFSATLWCFVC